MTVKNTSVGDPSGPYWERKYQNGVDTPLHLRKTGLWPVNPYALEQEAQIQNDTRIVNENGNPLNDNRFRTETFVQLSIGQPQYPAYADVLIKLREKWCDTDLNLGMYLSPEGRESVQMMTTLMMKMANGAHSLKRGDFGGFIRNLNELPRSARKASARAFNQGDLSGSFLAAHLGWEPMIKDIYEASGLVDLKEESHRISARKLGSISSVANNIASHPGTIFESDKKAQLQLTLDMKRKPTFSQRFGLDNPFLVAWELVPLSFVADYFLPIGRVIAGMGAVSVLYGSKGWSKTYMHSRNKISMPKGTNAFAVWGTQYYIESDIHYIYNIRKFDRAVYTPSFSDPLKNLRITLPSGVWKLGTMGSLLHQRLLSLRK